MVVRRNTNRLAGHTLRYEGAPHVKLPHQSPLLIRSTQLGRGLCSCGATGEIVDSNSRRKQWHRDHKDEVRRQQETAS